MRGEERAVRLDGKVDVGQDLQAVLCVVFCGGGGGVVPGHPKARRLWTKMRAGGVCTLDELSGSGTGRWAEVNFTPSTLDQD